MGENGLLCDSDGTEIAEWSCYCVFPLKKMCQRHKEKHLDERLQPGAFHYFLPISATRIITTPDIFRQQKGWVFGLAQRQIQLGECLGTLSSFAAEMENAFQDLQRALSDRQEQILDKVYREFEHEVQTAIEVTSRHALEPFEPAPGLQTLVWSEETKLVDFPAFNWRIETNPEVLDSAFTTVFDKVFPKSHHTTLTFGNLELFQEELEELKAQLAKEVEEHKNEVHTLNIKYQEEILQRRENEALIEQLNKIVKDTEDKLKTESNKYFAKKKNSDTQIDNFRQNLKLRQEELDKVKAQLAKELSEHKNEVNTLNVKYQEEIAKRGENEVLIEKLKKSGKDTEGKTEHWKSLFIHLRRKTDTEIDELRKQLENAKNHSETQKKAGDQSEEIYTKEQIFEAETWSPSSKLQPDLGDGRNEDRFDEEVFNASPGLDAEIEEPLEDQKWQCRGCGQMNSWYSETCNRCQDFKADEYDVAPTVHVLVEEQQDRKETKPGHWECVYCTLINNAKDRICRACAKTRKELLPPSPPSEEDKPQFNLEDAVNEKPGVIIFEDRHDPSTNKREVKPSQILAEENKAYKSKNREVRKKGRRVRNQSGVQRKILQEPEVKRDKSEDAKRQVPRTRPNNDKEWICLVCRNEIMKAYSTCPFCGSPKPQESSPEVSSKSDSWTCVMCGTVNFYCDEECSKCHSKAVVNKASPEPVVSIEETWTCSSCGTLNSQEVAKCHKCRVLKKSNHDSLDRKEEGWVCEYCQHTNIPRSTRCIKCYKRNNVDVPLPQEQTWLCPHCTRKNNGPQTYCEFCFKTADSKPSPEEPSRKCVDCGRAVIGSSTLCASCEVRKPTIPESTWKCKKCSHANRMDRRECRMCGTAKDEAGPKLTTGRCSKCGNATASSEGVCISCRIKAPAAGATWICSSCRAENTRSICAKCHKPKPYSRY